MKVATGLAKVAGMFRCDRVNPGRTVRYNGQLYSREEFDALSRAPPEMNMAELVRMALAYKPPKRRG